MDNAENNSTDKQADNRRLGRRSMYPKLLLGKWLVKPLINSGITRGNTDYADKHGDNTADFGNRVLDIEI